MAEELKPMAVSDFFDSMARMLSAGIGYEEAAALLCDTRAAGSLYAAAGAVHTYLAEQGGTLSEACGQSGYFPAYAVKLLAVGETTGRIEQVLRGLARYYEARDMRRRQIKSAVVYPAVLLGIMVVILAVLLARVLPLFADVYQSMAGGTAAAGYRYLQAAYAVGWAALAVTAIIGLALLAAICMGRTPQGLRRLQDIGDRLPGISRVLRKQALAGYTWALGLYLTSGLPAEEALSAAADTVENKTLHKAAAACAKAVDAGTPLEQAVSQNGLLEPLYARMLAVGVQSGSMAETVDRLSERFSTDAAEETDRLTGLVEPLLSGLLTLVVGVTLVTSMLPLVGMLGAIG